MNARIIGLVVALVMVAGAAWGQHPEIPLDLKWRLSLDARITATSKPWSESGSSRLAVGAPNKVIIVGEGEIIWESEPQYRDIVAVEHMETESEPMLVIAQQYSGLGCLTRFTGQNYEPGARAVFCRDNFDGWSQTILGIVNLSPVCINPSSENADQIHVGYWVNSSRSNNMDSYSEWTYGTVPYRYVDHAMPSEQVFVGLPQTIKRSADGFIQSAVGKYLTGGSSTHMDESSSWQASYLVSYGSNLEVVCTLTDNNGVARGAMCMRNGYDEVAVVEQQDRQNRITVYRLPQLEKATEFAVPAGDIISIADAGWESQGVPCLLVFYTDRRVLATDFEGGGVGERMYQLPQFSTKMYWGQYDSDPDGELLIVSDSSLALFDLAPLNSPIAQNPIPFTLHLSPPFPNPFNSMTRIEFSLGPINRGATKLEIFDPLGRRVAELIPPGTVGLPAGKYSVVWDAAGVPAGEYIIRLKAEEEVEAKSVQVVK